MKELHRRLKAVVARYRSAREASRDKGFEENLLGSILRAPTRIPSLGTLDVLAAAYDWDLCDVVYWALGRDRPARPPAMAAFQDGLARLPLSPERQERVRRLVLDWLRGEAPTPE